ncbi:MAG: TonB-dependent receptor [Thermoanaerobaculales bacterium]
MTATRSERPLDTLPVSMSLMSQQEIDTSPVEAVDDLLRTIPGIVLPVSSSLVQYPTRSTISMRGLGGTRALVLLDGVPINDPLTGTVQWNRVPLESVERVEVARGGAASLFGNYAMGGTINILTRQASADELNGKVAYGSNKTRRADVAVGEAVAPGIAVGLNASVFDTDGYVRVPPEDRGAIDIPSAAHAWTTQLRADFNGESGASGSVRAGYYKENLSSGTPLSGTRQDIFDLAASRHQQVEWGGEVTTSVFYERNGFEVFNSAFTPGRGRDAEYRSNTIDGPAWMAGGSMQWSRGFSSQVPLVSVGLDLQRLAADNLRDNFGQSGTLTSVQDSGGMQDNAGLFAEASYFPIQRLEILTSARLDHWRNWDGSDDRTPGGNTSFPTKRSLQLDPRLSLRYEISGSTAARAAIYRAFRAPNLQDLYRGSSSKSLEVVANPSLEPETLVGGEFGLDFPVGAAHAQIDVFQSTIDGVITRVPVLVSPVLTLQPRNLDQARSRGVEMAADARLASHLTLSAGYTFADSVALGSAADPTLVGKQTPEVPRHAASLALRLDLPRSLALTVRGIYVSTSYADAANQLAYDPHTLVDFFASRPFGPGLEIFVAVTNLFDTRYLDDLLSTVRLGAPRQVMVGLHARTALRGSGA